MPDRPAGAVEEEPDVAALDTSALEAMMAAVLFAPASAPQPADLTPAVSAMSDVSTSVAASVASGVVSGAPASPGIALPTATPASAVEDANVLADVVADVVKAVSTPIDGTNAQPVVELPEPASDVATAAMRVAAQAMRLGQVMQRSAAVRGKGAAVTDDANPTSGTDVEAMAAVTEMPDGASVAVNAVAPVSEADGTASSALSLLSAMDGVESVEVSSTATRPNVPVAGATDDADAPVGDGAGRAALVSTPSPMAAGRGVTAAASTEKAASLQSVPVASQVAETVRAAVLRGDHEIRLLLNPGDLGQITIRITEQNGALQLRLDTSRSSTRELLAREMPMLQQALEARDLRIERIQVTHSGSASANGSNASWQQGSGRQGQPQERDGSPAWSPVANLTQSEHSQREAHRAPRVIRHRGVLDRVA